MEKNELIVLALQQRIGELVTMYETQIASLRADITTILKEQEKQKEISDYSKEVAEKISD